MCWREGGGRQQASVGGGGGEAAPSGKLLAAVRVPWGRTSWQNSIQRGGRTPQRRTSRCMSFVGRRSSETQPPTRCGSFCLSICKNKLELRSVVLSYAFPRILGSGISPLVHVFSFAQPNRILSRPRKTNRRRQRALRGPGCLDRAGARGGFWRPLRAQDRAVCLRDGGGVARMVVYLQHCFWAAAVIDKISECRSPQFKCAVLALLHR